MILVEGPVRDYLARAGVTPGMTGLAASAAGLSHWEIDPLVPVHVRTSYDPATALSRRPCMKPDIHPEYHETSVTCSCGNDVHHPQHGQVAARCTPTSARPATRSTRASRRSWTSVAASTSSRSGTASASAPTPTLSSSDGARRPDPSRPVPTGAVVVSGHRSSTPRTDAVVLELL